MEIDGLKARTTASGIRVVELDWWADPARDSGWLERARRSAKSPAEFQRNVLRNWNIVSGATFFPEFAEVGREKYLYEPRELLNLPIIRGWDFGWRAPCCIWMQYSMESDRVFVLREFSPRGIAAHHFRDVCRYLSGQCALSQLDAEAQEWVEMLDGLPDMPRTPWFPPGLSFVDFAGPEINAVQSIAAKDPAEATVRQVFSAGNIEFSIQTGRVKGRAHVLRRMLWPRPLLPNEDGSAPLPGRDGWPGIVISPYCIDTLAMLDGGLTFKKGTKANPMPEEPNKDGKHDNTFDALTYALVGVVPPDGLPGITPGMPAEPVTAEDSIGWTL